MEARHASRSRGATAGRRGDVYDPAVDDELQLVAQLVAAAAAHEARLTDDEIDAVLLEEGDPHLPEQVRRP